MNAFTVMLTGTSTKTPTASVTLSVKTLVVAADGVAEKTRLKLPLNVSGICPATLGAVNVTGFVPLTVQVSIVLTADKLTREYASLAQVQPAGTGTATLLILAQPLLTTVNISSVFVLPALVEIGSTIAAKLPRIVDGVDMEVGVVIVRPLRVPVAEPLKVNGLVVPVESS